MKGIIAKWLRHLPQNSISRAVGQLAAIEQPKFLVKVGTRIMPNLLGIDLSEAEIPEQGFSSCNQLFTRKLQTSARPVNQEKLTIVAPTDGSYGLSGRINKGHAIQAKGITYDVARLLESELDGKLFDNGQFATFYLAPHNYHRIHSPVSGKIVRMRHIPGGLLPVFPESIRINPELFIRNERLISFIESPACGLVAVIKIGATAVGKISLSYDSEVISNVKHKQNSQKQYVPPLAVQKGDEIGIFHLGSTVVLLFQQGKATLRPMSPGSNVKMGSIIGTIRINK